MNKARKGYSKEYLARKELEADGWLIPFKSIRTRWATFDFANLFDLVAYKQQQRKYVSCKHLGNGNYYLQHQQDIVNFANVFGKPNESYELWLWSHPQWHGRGQNKVWSSGFFIKKILRKLE